MNKVKTGPGKVQVKASVT